MMSDEAKLKLVSDLKVKCQITWDNSKDTEELSAIIADAEYVINHKLGSELDYSESGLFHNLFLNYCWYVKNGCENDFDEAYRNELLMLRQFCEVKRYEAKNKEGA